MTDSDASNQELTLKVKCGHEIEKQYNYEINGLENISQNDEFNYQLVIKHKE